MFIDPALARDARPRFRSLPRGKADPGRRLRRLVARLAGPHARLLRHAEALWFSATFWGARHTISLAFAGPDAIEAGEAFVAALADHEFGIPGWIVADAAVVAVDHRLLPDPLMVVEAELLVLEEG